MAAPRQPSPRPGRSGSAPPEPSLLAGVGPLGAALTHLGEAAVPFPHRVKRRAPRAGRFLEPPSTALLHWKQQIRHQGWSSFVFKFGKFRCGLSVEEVVFPNKNELFMRTSNFYSRITVSLGNGKIANQPLVAREPLRVGLCSSGGVRE